MKIVCIGAGSVGLLVTAKLAAAGADVVLITRTEQQASALNESGLTLQEGDNAKVLHVPAASFERIDATGGQDMPDYRPDWVLLTVKQKHLSEPLLLTISKLLREQGRLLCFQNGIGHVDKIGRYVPPACIDLAVTTEGARRESASRVVHTGSGTTWIGCADRKDGSGDSRPEAEIAQKLMEKAMNEAGFPTFLSNQMKEIVWNKLLINAVINPLTALLRIRNGELPATGQRRQLMKELLREGIAAAEGSGVRTRDDLWEQVLEVCAKTARNESSMLQDVSAGRATEIEWINGAILDAARKGNIPAPTHDTIYKLVKAAQPAEEAGR
ncbi:2-dehydropantoate 2-reductase [Paenibacillus mesophilus]|uniref:ketopantoate reductase family protein n=1 Tax=Paenibacillus mesophilus TaxID=2582849 RepID=UPI00110E6EBC|nr:2-dehydropantoate 2-reductase [Paenibacillus mesophilus]TMV46683.1 2-dehydropantoate 2-reductase [Paenibacillus mesophilus]